MRSIARLLAPIAALTLLAGCSPAAPAAAPATETLTIEHAQGTATVAADPTAWSSSTTPPSTRSPPWVSATR